jgi:hypothetical protein
MKKDLTGEQSMKEIGNCAILQKMLDRSGPGAR